MNAALGYLGSLGLGQRWKFFNELEIDFGWERGEWVWGICTEFVSLGTASVVLGPLHIMFNWSIL